jgi:hypothetical protein
MFASFLIVLLGAINEENSKQVTPVTTYSLDVFQHWGYESITVLTRGQLKNDADFVLCATRMHREGQLLVVAPCPPVFGGPFWVVANRP